jgi:hypothetical protein
VNGAALLGELPRSQRASQSRREARGCIAAEARMGAKAAIPRAALGIGVNTAIFSAVDAQTPKKPFQ